METNFIKKVSYPHERFLTAEQMKCNRPCSNRLCYEMVRVVSLCSGCVKCESVRDGIVSGDKQTRKVKQ